MAMTSAERVAQYEWGYAGTRTYMGTPVTTVTTSVPTPHVRVYEPAKEEPTKITPARPFAPAPKAVEETLQKSQEWSKYPPTSTEQAQVALATGYHWDQFTRKWTRPAVGVPAAPQLITTREAPFGTPSYVKPSPYRPAAPKPAPQPMSMAPQYMIEPEVTERMRMLGVMAREDPFRYGAAYVTSAWATGPISAFGVAARTIARPFLEPSLRVARERELEAFARRTFRLEERPVETVGLGMLQVPAIVGIGAGMGTIGAKLAISAPKVGAAYALGTKALGVAGVALHIGPPLLKKEYVEVVGRGAEVLGAAPFVYVGYKKGVEFVLEREYPGIIAKGKTLAQVKKEVQLAKEAAKIPRDRPLTLKSVIKDMPSMRGKKGEVIYKYVKGHKGEVVVGGSVAERTQIAGRAPRDIDIYVTGDVKATQKSLYTSLERAGVAVTKGRGGKILYKGKTLVDIHTKEHLESLVFYRGATKTPEGISVMDVRGQFLRKAIGKFEPGQMRRRAKDIPAFERMVKEVIVTGRIKAETGFPLLKPYREAKVAKVEQLFRGIGRRGYAYPRVPKVPAVPIVPMLLPKPEKYYKRPKKVPRTPTYILGPKVYKDYRLPRLPKIPPYPPYIKTPKVPPIIPTYRPPKKPPEYPPAIIPPYRPGPPYKPPTKKPPYAPPTKPPTAWRLGPRKFYAPKKRKKYKLPTYRRRLRYTPTVLGVEYAKYAPELGLPKAPKVVGPQAIGIRMPVLGKLFAPKKRRRVDKKAKRRYQKDFMYKLGL